MIKPTVGRIVWYQPGKYDTNISRTAGQPLAAIVTGVLSDSELNLTVFDYYGTPTPRTKIPLIQDGDTAPERTFCEWMPFQKQSATAAAPNPPPAAA